MISITPQVLKRMIPQDILNALNTLSACQIAELRHHLQQLYKSKVKTENQIAARQFKLGHIVTYRRKGQRCWGLIQKINSQNISLISHDGLLLTIAPRELTLDANPSDETLTLFVNFIGPLSLSNQSEIDNE